MPSAMTSASDPDHVEVVTSVQRRRRWPLSEKLRAVEEASAPGMTVSYIAPKYGIHPSLLFKWRRLMTEGGQEAVRAVIDHGDILHCKLRRPSPPLAEMQAGVYS